MLLIEHDKSEIHTSICKKHKVGYTILVLGHFNYVMLSQFRILTEHLQLLIVMQPGWNYSLYVFSLPIMIPVPLIIKCKAIAVIVHVSPKAPLYNFTGNGLTFQGADSRGDTERDKIANSTHSFYKASFTRSTINNIPSLLSVLDKILCRQLTILH